MLMINLIIFGNGKPVEDLVETLSSNKINVIGVKQDHKLEESQQQSFLQFLESKKIPLVENIRDTNFKINLILSVNYYKIIDITKYKGILLLNLHIGLLPKYRGNNANAWAVINGEQILGYTIHKLVEELDAGEIYYKFEYKISNDNTYYETKKAINKDIKSNIEITLIKIYNKELLPTSQIGKSFTYCLKLKPKDGIIIDWNINSEIFLRKFFVFSKPLGTGLKFYFKEVLWEIIELKPIHNYQVSIGVPGSILYIEKDYLYIKTKDTAINVKLENLTNNSPFNNYFKMGMRI